MMKCQICRKSTTEAGVLVRHHVKNLSSKGIWRCIEHLPSDLIFKDGILNVNFSTGSQK